MIYSGTGRILKVGHGGTAMVKAKTTANAGKKQVARVQPAIVLFADLLGFSALVKNAKEEADARILASRIERFAEVVSGADFEDSKTRKFYKKQYWAFSDSIVVCWYFGSNAAKVMTSFDAELSQLSSLAAAQAEIMLTDGQLVRGGLAFGWWLQQRSSVVGDALTCAAGIEKSIQAPFIGVSHDLHQRYLDHPVRGQYSKDADPTRELFIPPCRYTAGMPALDYFMARLNEIDITNKQTREAALIPSGPARDDFRNQCFWENRSSYVRWHRDFVQKGLSHADPKVKKKYRALKQHHNFRVRSLYPKQPHMLVQ
jgi:hypothetical protein